MQFDSELEGKNREKIIEEARTLFFANGFEGTSIRALMNKLNMEPSLFYYYFKSKDELYDSVIDNFFLKFKRGMTEIIENGRRDSFRMMILFFDYFSDMVSYFNREYGDTTHPSTKLTIRERVLVVIRPYIRRMLGMLVADGARLKLHIEATTLFLSQGIGSIIIQQNDFEDVDMIKEFRKGIHLIMGLDDEMAEIMFPYYAINEDLPGISALIVKNKEYIYEATEYAKQTELIKKCMAKEIFVIRYFGKIVGVIGFSRKNKEINYICIEKQFEKKGIAMRLLVTAMAQFPLGTYLNAKILNSVHSSGSQTIRFFRKFGFGIEKNGESDEESGKEYALYGMIIDEPGAMQNNSRR